MAEVAALAPVLRGVEPPLPAFNVVYRLIGGSFAACGLIAWRRRPDSRSGPLMAATGVGFFVYPILSQVASPVAQTLGLLLAKVWLVAFAALLLTLTSGGRLRSWVLLAACLGAPRRSCCGGSWPPRTVPSAGPRPDDGHRRSVDNMNVICLLIAHRWTRVRPPDVASEETYLVCRRCGRQKYDVGPPIGAVGIGQHTL